MKTEAKFPRLKMFMDSIGQPKKRSKSSKTFPAYSTEEAAVTAFSDQFSPELKEEINKSDENPAQ